MSGREQVPVYLADAEPHLPEPFRAAADLRARVVLHMLFGETLVLGDSQSLNNPYLRELFMVGPERPHDLAVLLQKGYLRLARRASAPSFRAVRDEQAVRGVENVPSPEYAEWLDEVTAGHLVVYDGAEVASRFRSGLRSQLAGAVTRATGRYREVLEDARVWVEGQEQLFYKAIRDWKDEYPDRSGDALTALGVLESCTSLAYRSALPAALGSAMADRSSVLRVSAQGRGSRGEVRLPPTILRAGALSRVHADVLVAALASPARGAALAAMARIRDGEHVGGELLDGLAEFVETFHRSALESFGGADAKALNVLRWHEAQLRCRHIVGEDGSEAAALDVVSAEGEPVPGFCELFSQASPIATDQPPVPRDDIEDAMSRAIVRTPAAV
ncbi:hypothetical protein [Actinomadura sp. 3N508]|uniref:hypothetical protein n=1 Tax=Actinomadura sp. 3N508 TaxID=3375153 RepID=UPI00378CA804